MQGALDRPTLVLNRQWTPVHVTSVRHAITLVFTGRASIVCPVSYAPYDFSRWVKRGCQSGGEELRGVHFSIESPEIIVLGDYLKIPPRGIAFNRRNLIQRDDNTCQYCGAKFAPERMTIDHVMPVSRGGKTSWDNCVLSCHRCNGRKANRTPVEANMQLLKTPDKPKWSPSYSFLPHNRRPASWNSFLPDDSRELVTAE